MEAIDKPNERIALLEQQRKIAQGVLDSAERLYKAGFAHFTEFDYLRAKAHCLTIEIKLAKERDKPKPAA